MHVFQFTNQIMEFNVKKLIFPIAASLLLFGCGQDEPEAPSEPEAAEQATDQRESRREVRRAEEPSSEPAPDRNEKKVPVLEGQAETEGHGLTMIMDGSSPEAFEESLSLVAQDTSKEQYRKLDQAIRHLEVYSSAGWSGKASLYKSLDGMTAEEIIEKAQSEREERQNRQ